MKKLLKILLLLIVLVVGAAAGIGFGTDPRFDVRNEFTIDAPVEKVFAVVSDPKRCPEWMPVQSESERMVSVKNAGLLERLASGTEEAAKTGDVNPVKVLGRHTYVFKNGETSVEVEQRVDGKVYTEHVISDSRGMSSMFPEMHWGFEMADLGGGKTRLTPFMRGMASKPLGTLMNKVMGWSGGQRSFQEKMAKNVETLAKGGKVQ